MRDFHRFRPRSSRKMPFSLARTGLICIEQRVNYRSLNMSLPVVPALDFGPRCPVQGVLRRCSGHFRMAEIENPGAKPAVAGRGADRDMGRLDPGAGFGGRTNPVGGRGRGQGISPGRWAPRCPMDCWGTSPDQQAGYGERRTRSAMGGKRRGPPRSINRRASAMSLGQAHDPT